MLGVILLPGVVKAQTVEWARSAGGTLSDEGQAIAVDTAGNSYVTGTFQDTATFGPFTLTSLGVFDIFVAKYDTNGNVVWAQSAGGTGLFDAGTSIAVDLAGNSYVTGRFEDTATFGAFTVTSAGGRPDIFVVKFDGGGSVIWARSAGGTLSDEGQAIAVDTAGNSYVTGSYQETATFGPFTLTSAGFGDIFVAKYDPSGNVIWAKSAGETANNRVRAIAVDATGNAFVTGGFLGTATFGSFTLTSAGELDIFLAKYDTNGNVLWARSDGGTLSNEIGAGIAVDVAGNSYVTGNFSGTPIFGSITLTSAGGADIFVAKYDTNGNVVWAQSAGGTEGRESGRGIAVDAAGNSYVTGSFGFRNISVTATFGPFTLTNAGRSDIFVSKYDGSGNVLWARSAGGTTSDVGQAIAVDAAGNAYVTGFLLDGTATFGPFTLTGVGGSDIFVAKYAAPPLTPGAIPTVTAWGLMIMALVLLIGAKVYFNRRRAATWLALMLGVILLPGVVHAQTVEWARSAGGVADDSGNGVAVDAVGNSYVTGTFASTATFGPFTLTTTGSNDIFVAKYDASGNVLWVRAAGGTLGDGGSDIGIDAVGNSYVTGSYQDTATFGPFTLTSAGAFDIFVAKYDTSGNVVWARSAGGTPSDSGSAIAVDAAGNSYVTGHFAINRGGTANFGSFTLTSAGLGDIFLAKYDPSGNVLWARSAGGPSRGDNGRGIAVDAAGNSYVTGSYQETATFGPFTLTSAGFGDIFVAKYNDSGNVLWARSAGANSDDKGLDIGVDAAGNSYVTGAYWGTGTFGSFSLTSAGSRDIVVAKYDGSGNVLWARSAGGTSDDLGIGIGVDAAGHSYVTGVFEGTATFGPFTLTTTPGSGAFGDDIFVAKYDVNGNVLWARSAGGTSRDSGSGIGVDVAGNSYVTGLFSAPPSSGTAMFGPFTLTSAGGSDIFVAKFAAPDPQPGAIPTVTAWGLMFMALLLLIGAKVYFDRRRLSPSVPVDRG